MDVDFIYFDLGKVILEFDHEVGCRQMGQVAGVDPADVKRVVFDSGLEDKYETGLISSAEFHSQFCEQSGGACSQEDFLLAASDIFYPNRRIFPLISQLRSRGFPLGVLSNTCRAHWEFVYSEYVILREYFEPYVLSYEVQSMKPDSKIYDRALEAAGCSTKQCFFVDDKQENVDGAIAAGIDAVLYRSVPKLIADLAARGVELNL